MNIYKLINTVKPRVESKVTNKLWKKIKLMGVLAATSATVCATTLILYNFNLMSINIEPLTLVVLLSGFATTGFSLAFSDAKDKLQKFKGNNLLSWEDSSEFKLNSDEVKVLLSLGLNNSQKVLINKIISKQGYLQYFDLIKVSQLDTSAEKERLSMFCEEHAISPSLLDDSSTNEVEIEYNFQQKL